MNCGSTFAKTGTMEKLCKENQAVNAGDILAW
jgi:hypothetical protein